MQTKEAKPTSTFRPSQSGPYSRGLAEDPSGNQGQRPQIRADDGRQNELARYESMLANERTLLAYQRTAIMLAISGFTLLKLLAQQTYALALGGSLMSLGLAAAVIGFIRFRSMKRRIGD